MIVQAESVFDPVISGNRRTRWNRQSQQRPIREGSGINPRAMRPCG
ncbi:MAG: hypothetical protein IPL99_07135 [Candidatus Competibacteraceae bacterium]|nr:hypothetical protein [Candidatus Competibacteraceae bacterium]